MLRLDMLKLELSNKFNETEPAMSELDNLKLEFEFVRAKLRQPRLELGLAH